MVVNLQFFGGRGGSSGIISAPKVGDKVYIKDWFLDKIDLPSYAMKPTGKVEILEERGKAYKVSIDTETLDGERDLYYTRFVPKSVVETESQRKSAEAESYKRYKTGQQKYEKMVSFAKEHGVKGVRTGLRKETILKKIRNAGLDYKY